MPPSMPSSKLGEPDNEGKRNGRTGKSVTASVVFNSIKAPRILVAGDTCCGSALSSCVHEWKPTDRTDIALRDAKEQQVAETIRGREVARQGCLVRVVPLEEGREQRQAADQDWDYQSMCRPLYFDFTDRSIREVQQRLGPRNTSTP